MPAWLAAALRLLALGFGGGAAFSAGERVLSSGSFPGEDPTQGVFGRVVDQGGRALGFGGDGHRRRRRRRALTASDRQDIAFIAGMISKAAAKDFAVQLAARPR